MLRAMKRFYSSPNLSHPSDPDTDNFEVDLSQDDFTMDLAALEVFLACDAYILGREPIRSAEELQKVLGLLESINSLNNKQKSIQLQSTIIKFLYRYLETYISKSYSHVSNSLKKEKLADAELISLQKLCQQGLKYCTNLINFCTIIKPKINEFSKKYQNELYNIIGLAFSFSNKGKTNVAKVGGGFYYCVNQLEIKRKKNAIEKIKENLTAHCEHVEQHELNTNTYHYQSLKFSSDFIKKNEAALLTLTKSLPNVKDITPLTVDVARVKKNLESEMRFARLFAYPNPELIKGEPLDVIKKALAKKASYQALLGYRKNASKDKNPVFCRFIDKFNRVETLEELYALIVEGYQPRSKKNGAIIKLNGVINGEMNRNTGCGFYGCFGLFYQSTTHRYLTHLARDFQQIVDEFFDYNVPKSNMMYKV